MSEWKVKEGCPLKEMIDVTRGKLRHDFTCEMCIVNPAYCEAYRRKEEGTVNMQKQWLEITKNFQSTAR